MKCCGISALIFVVAVVVSTVTQLLLLFVQESIAFENKNFPAISGIISGAVSAFAAGLVLYQLKGSELLRLQDNRIHELEFYHAFINYWLEADRVFIEHPECRKFFYDNVSVQGIDDGTYQRLMAIAEYMDDIFVYTHSEIETQSKFLNAIPQQQIDSYLKYMQHVRGSAAFQHYMHKYREFINYNESQVSEQLHTQQSGIK